MRKIGFWEALKREGWFSKYVFPVMGMGMIIVGFFLRDTLILYAFGGIFMVLPFFGAFSRSNQMLECQCKSLIGRWDKYCKYCGRKNDLIK